MNHGTYLISNSRVEQFEDDWFGGNRIDLVSTTYTAGFYDAVGITWAPGASASEKRESLRRTFGETDRRLMTIYHFGGDESGDYSTAANGGHDAKYREFARELVGLGLGDTLIVPSHEFNLPWGRYPNDPANYASGMARLVREMMSVDGANFEFVYAPGGNRLGVTEECWPARADEWDASLPTPYVAPSFYDTSPDYPDTLPSGSELDQLRRDVWNGWHTDNLSMWAGFADSVGAQLAFREWGCATEDYRNSSGGDNPYFVRKMFEWFDANDVAFQTYWNAWTAGGGTGGHRIWPEDQTPLNEAGQTFRNEVSADLGDSGSSSSTDDGADSDSSETLGGYNQPSSGTLNWHVPLNENFADIENDIKSLDQRLRDLE